jgi:type IV secretory pathway VirB9-like protein
MPLLFIVDPEGKTSELVNYRGRSNRMVVGRLFAAAELVLATAAPNAGFASSAQTGDWRGERTGTAGDDDPTLLDEVAP